MKPRDSYLYIETTCSWGSIHNCILDKSEYKNPMYKT